MSENTKIEWCDATFNPWQGCKAVSPGCAHCYAEALTKRFGRDFGKRERTSEANWKEPLKWDRWCRNNGVRKKVFALSMGDWLDDRVPIEWLADFLELIRQTPNLDWLLLTKRPGNWWARLFGEGEEGEGTVQEFFRRSGRSGMPGTRGWEMLEWLADWAQNRPPHNVWVGTSVEDQRRADERIPELLRIPARVRFLSCEPLLGAVDLGAIPRPSNFLSSPHGWEAWLAQRIHWVIAGGESGPKARPMHPDWARSLRDQCTAAGVPFFFKQWGEWHEGAPDCPSPAKSRILAPGLIMGRFGKAKSGRLLDGREWNEFPGHAG